MTTELNPEKPPRKNAAAPKPSNGPRGAINHPINYEQTKQEPWIVSLLARLDKPRFKLDPSIVSELKEMAAYHTASYQEGRARLPVVRNKEDLVFLQEANALCLGQRDRVTDILVSYTDIKYALDAIWEKAEARLLENESFQKLTNAPARTAFITAVLEPVHKKRVEVNKVIAMAEIVREQLSHTHFSIKQHSDMGIVVLGQRSS